MKIAVLIKQVPGTTNVEIDPVTGTLKRDGIAGKMNPYDLFALETALSLKKELQDTTVTALTMGPNQASVVVREAIYMGCDNGYVISDRRFAGADVLATSRTLSGALKKAASELGADSFDIILCGKQTTDGDTAQVGPECAERLGIPHVANVLEVKKLTDKEICVCADMGAYEQTLTLPLPALLTVEKDVNTPRLPSIKRKYELEAEGKSDSLISFISLDDFEDNDPKKYGLNGSPTQVERIFPPKASSERETFTGSADELSEILLGQLEKMKLIQKGR
ncbi:MAG: electron transfer flavoprotein subunit beta/FixA family protein [Eubacteriales bacterium]